MVDAHAGVRMGARMDAAGRRPVSVRKGRGNTSRLTGPPLPNSTIAPSSTGFTLVRILIDRVRLQTPSVFLPHDLPLSPSSRGPFAPASLRRRALCHPLRPGYGPPPPPYLFPSRLWRGSCWGRRWRRPP